MRIHERINELERETSNDLSNFSCGKTVPKFKTFIGTFNAFSISAVTFTTCASNAEMGTTTTARISRSDIFDINSILPALPNADVRTEVRT